MLVYGRRKSILKESALVVVLMVGVLLFEFLGVLDPVRHVGEKFALPFLELNTKIVVFLSQPYRDFQVSHKAVRRVQDLEFKYAAASAELGELESLRAENKELRNILENSDRKLEKTILATPVVSLAQPAISVGKNAGVSVGNVVLSSQTLLGTVRSVSENQSEVGLLSQKDSQPILAKTESGVQGLVRGDGRQVLFTEVPQNEVLHENERIVTLGQKGIPRDIFIGRIRSIEVEPQSSAQKAVLEQFVTFYEVLTVEVR